MKEVIVWTALPNGRRGDHLRLSVFIAPQLDASPQAPVLGSFPRWLEWPETLSEIAFEVLFDDGQTVQSRPGERDPDMPSPDPGLWAHLFSEDTPVSAFLFKDYSNRVLRSYPTKNVLSYMEDRYRHYASASPTELPETEDLLRGDAGLGGLGRALGGPGLFGSAAGQPNYDEAAKKQGTHAHAVMIEALRARSKAVLDARLGDQKAFAPGPPEPGHDFQQFRYFHLPRTTKRLPLNIPMPEMDFHRMLSSAGQHPVLLRRLGLVVDLLVPIGGGLPQSGQIHVVPTPSGPSDRLPRTAYRFMPTLAPDGAFFARSKELGEQVNRFLRLGHSSYDVVQTDVDGAAEKTIQLAVNLTRMLGRGATADTPKRSSLPSLQSSGLSVIRTGRAQMLHEAFVRAKGVHQDLNAAQPAPLFAEDLTRGYRVDVLDGTSNRWRSLCARVCRYDREGPGPALLVAEDEGWTATAPTESTDPGAPGADDLHLQESLFRWTGWSLVSPRPGKRLNENQQAEADPRAASSGFPIIVTTKAAPDSLPKLRFGAAYRMRARAVDLAGNSASLEGADELTDAAFAKLIATRPLVYRRHEPVAQPTLRLRVPVENSPGEEIERLLIRSFNQGAAVGEGMVGAGELSTQQSERHLAPTGAGQLMAETHGMFDVAQGVDKTAYNLIKNRDGTYDSEVYPQGQLPIPYLPDPLGRIAALTGLPHKDAPSNTVTRFGPDDSQTTRAIQPGPATPLDVTHVDFASAGWPDWKAFRLMVVAAEQAKDPEWAAGPRILTVFLTPGEVARVRLSAALDDDDLPQLAPWQWIVDQGKDGALHDQVLAGLHWMLTPYRVLTLVHAVQRPLVKPEFQTLAPVRRVGRTYTDLKDEIPISGRSTSRLDVAGSWSEPIDTGPAPARREGRSPAFSMQIAPEDSSAEFGPEIVLSLIPIGNVLSRDGDERTRFEIASSRAQLSDASTRWGVVGQSIQKKQPTRPMAQAVPQAQLPSVAGPGQPIRPLQPGLWTPSSKSQRTIGRHEFGDTRHRRVDYVATATTRFREDLPFSNEQIDAAEANDGPERITRHSEPRSIDVPSSARPAAPDVVYVVPTFGWQESEDGSGRSRTRAGGGLRVYLRRPWFSSGDGELLGVVLPQIRASRIGSVNRKADKTEQLRPFVTQWGMDPIWRSAPTSSQLYPTLAAFKNPTATESGLTLDEVPNAKVRVAGYRVGGWDENGELEGYDPERELWYCDLEIDPGDSYFPFIRLALARYQPNSVTWDEGDVKLSRVVLADFAQLTPDRTATVSYLSATRVRLTVTGLTAERSSEQEHGQTASLVTTTPRFRMRSADPPRPERRVSVGPLARFAITSQTGGNTVEVAIESLPPGASEDLGWMPVASQAVELAAGPKLGGRTSWSGELDLPEPRGSQRFRLAIREYEWYMREGEWVTVGNQKRWPISPRLVYADTLEI